MINPELIPLGVSDPEGRVGAVSQSHTDIDLINLATGDLLCPVPEIGSPLMIDGPHLICWQTQSDGHQLRLSRMNLPPSEAAIEWSPPFEFPEWLAQQRSADADFAVKFGRQGNAYVMFWKARRHYRGGAPPPPQLQIEIERQEAFERIDFDVRTLAVLRRSEEDGFADDRARSRRGADLARHAGGFVYRQAGQLYNAPWVTPKGERYLRSFGAPEANAQRLSIVHADVPDGHPVASIDAHELHQAVPELSLDGQHLAVVEREEGAAVRRIYSSLNGELIVSLPYREGFGSFRVIGCRLLYLEEKSVDTSRLVITVARILYAVDTDGGKPLWSYELESLTISNSQFLPP
jgi:hypothetical protein